MLLFLHYSNLYLTIWVCIIFSGVWLDIDKNVIFWFFGGNMDVHLFEKTLWQRFEWSQSIIVFRWNEYVYGFTTIKQLLNFFQKKYRRTFDISYFFQIFPKFIFNKFDPGQTLQVRIRNETIRSPILFFFCLIPW